MKKLKILQVNKLYYPWIGGMESVVRTIAEKLNSETEMTVLVCRESGKGKKERINGVNIIRAGSMGIKFSMPLSLSFPFLVRKYAKNADVLILHDPFPLGDLAVLLSGFRGKVIVWWHSDIIKQKHLVKIIKPVINGILNRADAIFTTSENYISGSEYLPRFRDKCRIVSFGIEEKKYLESQLTPILSKQLAKDSHKKLLFVGRLVYYKGVGVLIDAFARVSGAELFIVGTGSDEDALRAQAEPLGDKVHFLGVLSDEELKSAFADCDIFILPSVEKSEAFGIVQLEAMIYGKPVINTDLETSVPLVSLHGQTGLTVKAGDVNELAEAMNTLVNDTALCQRLGAAAKERVITEFTVDIMTEKVKRYISELLNL